TRAESLAMTLTTRGVRCSFFFSSRRRHTRFSRDWSSDVSSDLEHAVVVADFLDEIRERMALLIPEDDADPYSERREDRLTVLTMSGLTLPKDNVGREHWTDAEALGVQLLNLAAWLTQRSVYERPKD